MKKIKIFVNNDLDSAGALMVTKWALGDKSIIDHSVSNIFNIKGDYERFVRSTASNAYSKIFILNMMPYFELEDNTMVFTKAEERSRKYKGKIDKDVTTTNMMLNFFKPSLDNPTQKQLTFVDTINQFYTDGGSKKEALKLNAVFSYGRNKHADFYTRFIDGLDDYTTEENVIIKNYTRRLSDTYKNVKAYEHSTNKGIYVATVNDMEHKYEILDLLFKKLSPKMLFLVDLESGLISVRKDIKYDINMQKLCDSLIEGRSLSNCAGGRYTEKFVDFSRAFR